jgi:uncharacterized phiE125 gp8 family phage protein
MSAQRRRLSNHPSLSGARDVSVFTDEIGCSWTLQTAATLSALSLSDAKQHLRITDNASDLVIAQYIAAATEEAEQYMGRGLLTQTWKLQLDWFANVMPLPMAAPLQSVTSVKYYDTDGTQQTLSTDYYGTDTVARPGAVVLKPGQSWPSVQSERRNGRVEIVYVVGFTSADAIPERIRQGLRQFVAYLDLDRDGLEPLALNARQAAERCWSDRVTWTPPEWGC